MYICPMKRIQLHRQLFTVCFFFLSCSLLAQKETIRQYTEQHPLVYEDACDLWPYTFINDEGKPDGFNIDLIKVLLDELNIPYVIKLKTSQEAFADMRNQKSDLMLGLVENRHKIHSTYGHAAITLFTQSVASPNDEENLVKSFGDLANSQVMVRENSLCQQLMNKKGWKKSAIPCKDMQAVLKEVNEKGKGQIVWNTLSLKWLIRQNGLDNLKLTPINMPHGEYKFISHDTQLLHLVDSVYIALSSTERLIPIQNKWFYPERKKPTVPEWFWFLVGGLCGVTLLFLLYYIIYWYKGKRYAAKLLEHKEELTKVLGASQMQIWSYEVAAQLFTVYEKDGKNTTNYTTSEFAKYFHPADFERLMEAIQQVAEQKEETATLEVKAYNTKNKEDLKRSFGITLSVLRSSRKGKPTVILGTWRDITEEKQKKEQQEGLLLRYQAMFNSPMVDVVFYDKDGYLKEINKRACETFQCDHDAIIQEHITFQNVLALDIEEFDFHHPKPFYATMLIDFDKKKAEKTIAEASTRQGKIYYEIMLNPAFDENHELIGVITIGRDRTESINSIMAVKQSIAKAEAINKELTNYISNINYILQESGVRVAEYLPDSRTLTIFSGINQIQYQLSQARCMTLVDEHYKKRALHMFTKMDSLSNEPIDSEIRCVVRTKQHYILHLETHFIPSLNEQGQVVSYFGLCRDVSELKATERQLAEESVRAQKVENDKNTFLKNMSYEIRTPLNAVVGFAELFDMEHSPEDEELFIQQIFKNSDILLHLINNILFLSRLDAGMIEFNKQPTDFTVLLEEQCRQGWNPYRKEGVSYIIDSTIQQLVVNIDASNLGLVIQELAENAAQHTEKGTVRVRFDYIGKRLSFFIEDTGCGIERPILRNIFQRFVSDTHSGGGLGLPICKELIDRMNGTIEIDSEPGEGTTVWVNIPCQATSIIRKKND